MSKLRLTLACWDYDRARALAEGSVVPDGIDLNVLELPVEETFFRMLRNREFDAAEMSLSSYTVSLGREKPPFIAIPAFPSRLFRHNGIFISTRSGIREPKDLIGKRIGVPEYQLTAPVWMRGGRASPTFSSRPGSSSPPVRYSTLAGSTPYSSCRMPRCQTGAVSWYSGTPMRLPIRSLGSRMPLLVEMKIPLWRKSREGNTGMAMKGGFVRASDTV